MPIVDEQKEDKEFAKRQHAFEQKQRDEGVWTMYFYGSISKEGDGAGVWIISPDKDFKFYSFKLTFECTNNVAEFEALRLGLNALKELKANRIDVYGDLELVINQVNGTYQTKHPRIRAYRNEFWDMLGNFFNEHRVMVIPRIQNRIAH